MPLLPSPLLAPSPIPRPLDRLRSPIHLPDSCTASIPPPCIPSSRRRQKTGSHALRRRRLSPRVPYPAHPQLHAFDSLPWISTLEAAPELLNPWDIADLSLIPDSCLPDASLSGSGPVRRRKSLLRSNPIASSHSGSPHPIRDTSLLTSSAVSTPRSRFTPSRVLFQNLMPVPFDCRPEHSHPCINSSRINF